MSVGAFPPGSDGSPSYSQTTPAARGFRDSPVTRKLWRTGELLALARSRGARPPRPCSSAPSRMSLLPTPTRRARRSPRRPRHARARVVPETVRSTNLAAPVTPKPHPPTRGFRDSRVTRKLWQTGELFALARSRGARPPRPCSSAPSPMSLLPTPTRRASRSLVWPGGTGVPPVTTQAHRQDADGHAPLTWVAGVPPVWSVGKRAGRP